MRKLALLLLMLITLTLPIVSAQGTIKSVNITVYETGYVKVTEVFVPLNVSVVVSVPLLTDDVAGIFVTDSKGNPLPFEQNGSSVDVYITGNVSEIVVTYFTAALTSKKGDVWTLTYSANVPVAIHFPRGVIIVDLSDVPLSITENSITMPPGNQSISYTLPVPSPSPTQSPTGTTSTKTNTTSSQIPPTSSTGTGNPDGSNRYYALVLLLVPIFAGALYYLRRKEPPKEMPIGRNEYAKKLEELGLNTDEINALLYVYDQGGKTKQADVRKALGIPKTTAWRMFKRLEEKGLVRVYKRGKENWVELVF